MSIWYTVYGQFAPDGQTGRQFESFDKAVEYAEIACNDWAPKVIVIRSEEVWVANVAERKQAKSGHHGSIEEGGSVLHQDSRE